MAGLGSINEGAGLTQQDRGLTNLPYCRVHRATQQAIPYNTITTISWTSAGSDAFGMWSAGAPTIITIPPGHGGIWQFSWMVSWDQEVVLPLTERYVEIVYAGQVIGVHRGPQAPNGYAEDVVTSLPWPCAAGQALWCRGYHLKAAANDLNLATNGFAAVKLSSRF